MTDKNLSELIHDTNASSGKIIRSVEYINKWFKDNAAAINAAELQCTNVFISLEYIKTAKKEIQESVDLFYKNTK